MFRRIAAISLLFMFLIYLGGVYPVFKLGQWHVRTEMKRRIKESVPESELFTISFSTSHAPSIEWLREGKEFRYKGRMYDVVRTKNTPDSVHYQCIDDSQETHLFAHLDFLVKKQLDEHSNPTANNIRKISTLFFSLLYLPIEGLDFHSFNASSNNQFAYLSSYSEICLDQIPPPPKYVI